MTEEEEKVIREIKNCKNPEDIVEEFRNGSKHVARFKSTSHFMDRCKAYGATPNNSITFYDEHRALMYIKYPYIATF